MFSLGVVFYELLFKKELYCEKMINGRVKNEPIDFESEHVHFAPVNCVELLKKMTEFDSELRISPAEALEHMFSCKGE